LTKDYKTGRRVTKRCKTKYKGILWLRESTKERQTWKRGHLPRLAFRLCWKGYGCNPLACSGLLRPELGTQEIATLQGVDKLREAGMQGECGCYCGCKTWSMLYFFQEGHRKQTSRSWGVDLWPGGHICVRRHVA